MDAFAVFNTVLGVAFTFYLLYLLGRNRTVANAALSWFFFVLGAFSLCVASVTRLFVSNSWSNWPGFQLCMTVCFAVCVFLGRRRLPSEQRASLARVSKSPILSKKQQIKRNNCTATNLLSALKEADPATLAHSKRVSELAVGIASELGLKGAELEEVRTSGLLHDVGKIGVRAAVLHKDQRLTEDEWYEIRNHARLGQRMLEREESFPHVSTNVLCHHEKYDGTGYPVGLQGEEIPLISRIVSVADAFDTITYGRHYQKARDEHQAVDDLLEHAGTQFDPAVVMAFLRVLRGGRAKSYGSGKLSTSFNMSPSSEYASFNSASN